MWSSSWLGREGSNVQVLIHEREWGLGEEIDHLLILANLAGEHCLSVQRDGQNDWLPVAAGSSALISTLFTWSWIDVCLFLSCLLFHVLAFSQGLTQTPACLTTCDLASYEREQQKYLLWRLSRPSLLSPAYSSKGTDLISYLKATFHLPPRLSLLASSGIFQTNFY